MRGTRTRRTAAAIAAVVLAAVPTIGAVPVQDEDLSVCEPQDPEAPFEGTDWAQERLNFQKAWPFTDMGTNVRVAVIDTGIGTGHQQLATADIDEASAISMFDEDEVPPTADCDGHGTAAGGIIAGQAAPGYSTFVGVAPEATLIPIRVTNEVANSPANELLAEAIRYAVDTANADVINISFETSLPFPALGEAVEYALDQGVVVVAPTGNHQDQQAYPAAYPGVIGVGAIGQEGVIAEFSGFRAPVSVVAPGDNVVLPWPWGGHVQQAGTSFAAPYVAGVAALIVDRFDGNITPAEVKRRIELTADETGYDLPDQKYGWGVVNAYAAVTEQLPDEAPVQKESGKAERVIPPIERTGPEDTTTRNVALAVTGGGLGAVLLTLGGVAAYRRGRERGWRPGVPQRS